MAVFCTKCGAQNEDYAQVCSQCQTPLPQIGGYQKLTAGICGILVGGFGIHKFILGYTTEGIIQIVLTFITCGIGSVIGLVEGIIYLTKTDEDFVRTYIQNKKGWF